MQTERENTIQPSLKSADFNIAGNVFRAYFDDDNKIVAVLDFTINDIKPYVMLAINPDGDRKWDDILVNDYGIDLETIRPKKDNKYQKLDIEYSGLAQYSNLIQADTIGNNIDDALDELNQFRRDAAIRSAQDRQDDADATAERARETINKTNETISELNARLKALKSRLTEQRRNIGREPTKQTAAKILRTESLIDATNDKIVRAKKRLANAQKRMASAEEDAEIAREILDKLNQNENKNNLVVRPEPIMPAIPENGDVVIINDAPVPMMPGHESTDIVEFNELTTEPKAEKMADDDVKPLFNEDPNILDDEIAFKPIDFSVPVMSDNNPGADVDMQRPTPPMREEIPTFIPPVSEPPVVNDTPILDSVAPIGTQNSSADDMFPGFTPIHEDMPPAPQNTYNNYEQPSVAPISPTPINPTPMPEISPVPADSAMRPTSPVVAPVAPNVRPGTPGGNEIPVMPVNQSQITQKQKPAALYYVMLIALIALSIFTLWLYQKSANDGLPEINTPRQVVEEVIEQPAPVVEPEPAPEPVAEPTPIVEPEPIVEPVAEPEPEPEPEPESVFDMEPVNDTDVIPEPSVAPVADSPFLSDQAVERAPTKSVLDVAEEFIDKPVYNVSQQENMFVAAPDYETDAPTYYEEESVVEEEQALACEDGVPPDADGCCPGESAAMTEFGELACCPDNDPNADCFPPLK